MHIGGIVNGKCSGSTSAYHYYSIIKVVMEWELIIIFWKCKISIVISKMIQFVLLHFGVIINSECSRSTIIYRLI
jgi:hypothetical protein